MFTEEWVTRVSALVYDVYAGARSVEEARYALGLHSIAFQPPNSVEITGGSANFSVLRVQGFPKEPTDAVPLAYAESALSSSGLPFTAPGDLLVFPGAGEPSVLHRGTNGQLLDRSLQWVTPPSAANLILGVYAVSVGPIEHGTAHDQWFTTISAYNTWAQAQTVIGTLTVLPNGIPDTDTSDFYLPRAASGGLVVLGQPQNYDLDPVTSAPNSQLRLIAHDTYFQTTRLSMFKTFDIGNARFQVDEWDLDFPNGGTSVFLNNGCQGVINTLYLRGVGNHVWEIRSCHLDIGTLQLASTSADPENMVLRIRDSDVYVEGVVDNALSLATRARIDCQNTSLYIRDRIQSANNVAYTGLDSDLHLGCPLDMSDLLARASALFRVASSSYLIPGVFTADNPRLLSAYAASTAKIGSRSASGVTSAPVENCMFGVSEQPGDEEAATAVQIQLGVQSVLLLPEAHVIPTLVDDATALVITAGLDGVPV